MDIIITFGYRKYIFHSQSDIVKANHLWIQPCNQNEFEDLLEQNNIDFEYEL